MNEGTKDGISPPIQEQGRIGRPRLRWQNCVERDIRRELEVEDWIILAQDRGQRNKQATHTPVSRKHEENTEIVLHSTVRTETIFPSVGMYAGLLLSLSRVCRVLKVVSSLAFSSSLGGL